MGTLQSWRKAYGAIKDTTTVGLANLNSDFKDLDIAIVKATNHVECPPKERHIRKIMAATSINRPRADVAYCIHALSRRLAKTHNWTVALKTLIVIHRTLREGDPTFREELLNFSQRGQILQLANFKDDSSPIAWDCSAWVRTYALFLEERLECFRVLKYDVEAERLKVPAQGTEKGHSRTRELDTEDLLEQLPALQQLLYRLLGCLPEGAAISNYVVQYALALALKESFRIYCSINDGIINLVDKFFEMPRHEAMKALEIYKKAGQQAASLSDFYEVCRGLELARNFQFPNLKEPPQSFLATMEEYVREAPRVVTVPREPMEFPERLLLTYKPEEAYAHDDEETKTFEDENPSLDEPKRVPSNTETASPPLLAETVDLLGLNTINPDASAIEETNALALAIVPSNSASTDSTATHENGFDPSGWELALVTAPSSMSSSTVETQLGGGFDKLTLDSLYDEAAYRQHQQQQQYYGPPNQQQQQQYYGPPNQQQQQYYGPPNPFMAADPFAVSSQIAAPPAVQMAAMAQQQSALTMPSNPFGPQTHFGPPTHPLPRQQMFAGGTPAPNPFGDTTGYGAFHVNNQPHQNNPFGSPLL